MEKPIRYHNRIRYGAAFAAAFYILFHGRPLDIAYALTSVGFYIAFAVSLGVALLLVQIVHKATVWLDARCGWRSNPVQRSIMQFTLGVFVPSLVDLLLISAYLQVMGEDVLSSGFLLVDFPLIVCFLIFLNIYYLVHYLLQTESATAIALAATHGGHAIYAGDDTALLTIDYNGLFLHFDVVEDILYFYRAGRKVKAATATGKEYPVNLSIRELEDRYAGVGFCRINRAVIINHKAVQGYEVGSKRDTLQVLFKPLYLHHIKNPKSELYQVTKEHIAVFKSGLLMA